MVLVTRRGDRLGRPRDRCGHRPLRSIYLNYYYVRTFEKSFFYDFMNVSQEVSGVVCAVSPTTEIEGATHLFAS